VDIFEGPRKCKVYCENLRPWPEEGSKDKFDCVECLSVVLDDGRAPLERQCGTYLQQHRKDICIWEDCGTEEHNLKLYLSYYCEGIFVYVLFFPDLLFPDLLVCGAFST